MDGKRIYLSYETFVHRDFETDELIIEKRLKQSIDELQKEGFGIWLYSDRFKNQNDVFDAKEFLWALHVDGSHLTRAIDDHEEYYEMIETEEKDFNGSYDILYCNPNTKSIPIIK